MTVEQTTLLEAGCKIIFTLVILLIVIYLMSTCNKQNNPTSAIGQLCVTQCGSQTYMVFIPDGADHERFQKEFCEAYKLQ